MNRVGTGWNKWNLDFGFRHAVAVSGNGETSVSQKFKLSRSTEGAPSVFVALPRKAVNGNALAGTTTTSNTSLVYCQKPVPHQTTSHRKSRIGRIGSFFWRAMPLVVLVATIFASIGMLQIIVEGVQIAEYYPPGYLKTQSWRGGSGPSPLDAVKSDYQNALTRDMVAAGDTVANRTAAKESRKKSKADSRIKLSNSRYQSSQKKGLHNLKLKVFNGTQNTLDKVVVEVDFLGKKGQLLQTENYTTSEVGPLQERTITIPEGTPGLSVAYRIREVRSRKHVTQLYNL